ncbi:hypothetical protein [Rothia nasimurium]|uniref:hypothetical protein n=1 Tax=Rothia nasimurium TaxID=85336 RepID=UPI001F2153A3|nr:hypothetical protein [Rothia nasimurium]
MTRKKTIPVPSEAIFDTVRRQYETSTLHLEAVNEKIENLKQGLAFEETRAANLREDIDAMADFLGINEEKAA